MTKRRIMLKVAYDGTAYCGYQIQPNGLSIEEVLNNTLSDFLKEEIKVIGASRTDAGVHSMGNVVVFDTLSKIPGEKFSFAINRFLPEDIVIRESKEVSEDFHPRKNKSFKLYRYRILNDTFNIPMYRNYSYHFYRKLDIENMKKAAGYLIGSHDFTSFCAVNTPVVDKVRNILEIDIKKENNFIDIYVKGEGFLYNMVRIIAGTLIEVGCGHYDALKVKNILEACDRNEAGPTAPARGLTLMEIKYR
ncbi:tRNA pseudouridine38-40 synthase [Acetitomaculum ruminis DSM 5522]|uniref:tRNA pseudouridine synthase A n=1 Tax=Acetitomaculum ruminis DSM 5522 TaxID=1120918 RepID=A0A1I0WXK4_9FIRM|nr:tRNA pseudouridine(38-40) synthase TruA [Acetitomaculum ruminis]SFA93532.1 tRNA pseudouridine38-40 synthase [Acetitomaculum ruminis DSM 5522]